MKLTFTEVLLIDLTCTCGLLFLVIQNWGLS